MLIPEEVSSEPISYQVRKMPPKSELNLVGISWPVCLLKFKCVLNDLGACDVLDVTARDPEVVDNIIMIVDRSGSAVINQCMEGDIYRLSIEKKT